MKGFVYITFFILISSLPLYSKDHAELMNRIINNYNSLVTISASITQQIYNSKGTYDFFSGEYKATAEGLIRIDYYKPARQIVIYNREGLFWYYPSLEVVYISKNAGGQNDSLHTFPGKLSREGNKLLSMRYEGSIFYGLFRRAHVYYISGKGDGGIRVWIDPEGRYILRRYVLDRNGRELIREIYNDYVEINKIYLPSVIELHVRGAAGVTRTLTKYSRIEINGEINPGDFNFTPAGYMEVRRFND